jgi:hypothetical protein
MRAPIRIASAALALLAIACTPSAKQDAANDAFKRDLALASATNLDVAAPAVNPALLTLETAPAASPKPSKVVKKAESGPIAVQSEAPTVQAEPEPEPAVVEETMAVATTTAPAPAPVESNEPVAVAPRPTPVPAAPAGGGDYGRGSSGGVYGGGIGVVIRGGGVGDGDHCEIRPRGGIIFRSPVYSPRPMAGTSNPGRIATPRGITIVRR